MPLALQEAWQFGVLAAATLLLLAVRRGGVAAVLLAAAMGLAGARLCAPLPATTV